MAGGARRICIMVSDEKYNELKRAAVATRRTVTACAEIAITNYCEMVPVEIQYLAEKSYAKRHAKITRSRRAEVVQMSAPTEVC